jgi:hypothetical protein
VPRERAVEAAGNGEKRQSLRLCLSSENDSWMGLDLAETVPFAQRQR